MQFSATVELGGKNATGIRVPPEVVSALGAGKRPAVRVTINGHTYRSTVASMDAVFMLPVSEEVRVLARVAAGDLIGVEIELDTEPREVAVPADFADALAQAEDARQFFDGLSYSNKRRVVMGIDDAKTAETRLRRIGKAVNQLREGKI